MIQHLILHKVRGEPAFDVAHLVRVADETVWIVSTSGHRAYPCMTWPLEDLLDTSDINNNGTHNRPTDYEANEALVALPDHYQTLPATPKRNLGELLAKFHLRPQTNGTSRMRRI